MSETKRAAPAAEKELTPEEKAAALVRLRERQQAWLLRLQIVVLGVSLGLFAKWIRDYATTAGPASKPAVKQEPRTKDGTRSDAKE